MQGFFYVNDEEYINIFTNDSGKWIVVENYNQNKKLPKHLVNDFKDKYGLDLDSITEEVMINPKGDKRITKRTYLFEIKE